MRRTKPQPLPAAARQAPRAVQRIGHHEHRANRAVPHLDDGSLDLALERERLDLVVTDASQPVESHHGDQLGGAHTGHEGTYGRGTPDRIRPSASPPRTQIAELGPLREIAVHVIERMRRKNPKRGIAIFEYEIDRPVWLPGRPIPQNLCDCRGRRRPLRPLRELPQVFQVASVDTANEPVVRPHMRHPTIRQDPAISRAQETQHPQVGLDCFRLAVPEIELGVFTAPLALVRSHPQTGLAVEQKGPRREDLRPL